ncbi:hypothetical protein HK102_000984 [Quaeritorhiza haematococci]|nr:hypothetical protein HK102_000984 [Quaeritorhiza haematococci]
MSRSLPLKPTSVIAIEQTGRAAASFPILGKQQVDTQQTKARVDYMDSSEWPSFHADTAAMAAFGKVTAQQIQSAKPDIPAHIVEATAERVRIRSRSASTTNSRLKTNILRIYIYESGKAKEEEEVEGAAIKIEMEFVRGTRRDDVDRFRRSDSCRGFWESPKW